MVNSLREKRKATGRKLVHQYAPRGGCKEVMEARDEEVLISGPAGTGKSRACLEKIHLICLQTPNVRALILRKTARSLASSGLVTWRKYVIPEAMATGAVVYYGGSSAEPAQYRYKNGSVVVVGGLDNADRVMSTEYDIIYIQEATEVTVDDLEKCSSRLRNWVISFQQLLMDCNPAGAQHFLKLRCDEGLSRLIESRHEDNPMLFDLLEDGTYQVTKKGAKYIAILDRLTGVRYKRLRRGLWVSAEGQIYEEWDPAVHVLAWNHDEEGKRIPLPDEWERYWVIDFGIRNPFVLKCYAVGDDGEIYMYREIYMTGRTVQDHAETIMDIVCPEITEEWHDHLNKVTRTRTKREWIEPQPVAIICDHDAQARKTFEKATGLGTKAAMKDVSTGLDLVQERIKVDPETKLTQFYYMADALVERDQILAQEMKPWCSQQEFPGYVFKVNADGRTTDEPVKRDDHGMDTDRYLVMELDYRGKARASQLAA